MLIPRHHTRCYDGERSHEQTGTLYPQQSYDGSSSNLCVTLCTNASSSRPAAVALLTGDPYQSPDRDSWLAPFPANISARFRSRSWCGEGRVSNNRSGSVAEEIAALVCERAGPRFESHSGRSPSPDDSPEKSEVESIH
uniref:Uncharacterized protein n=1 Tax=Anopheles culicifacies TaxID=139723 RepID=A0A182MIY7_9DIPT